MRAIVADYMNSQFVHLREGDFVESSAPALLRGTPIPVLDCERRPIAMVLASDPSGRPRACALPQTVSRDTSILVAALLLCDARAQHLVAVDELGRAVGVISAVDIVRGLLGLVPEKSVPPVPAADEAEPVTARVPSWTKAESLEPSAESTRMNETVLIELNHRA